MDYHIMIDYWELIGMLTPWIKISEALGLISRAKVEQANL